MDTNIRNLLWRRYFPGQSDAKCPICGTRDISFDDFDAAHIVPDGKEDIDNLVPTCRKCNDACKKKNLLMYKYENFPNIHTTTSWIPNIKSLIDEIEILRNEVKNYKDNPEKLKIIPKIEIQEKQEEAEISNIPNVKKDEINPIQKHKKSKNPISGFILNNKEYSTYIYRDIIKCVCDFIASEHNDFSQKVLSLSGFARVKDDLFNPYNIKGTNIFVETNLSSESVIYCSNRVLKLFGYTEDKLKLKYINKS